MIANSGRMPQRRSSAKRPRGLRRVSARMSCGDGGDDAVARVGGDGRVDVGGGEVPGAQAAEVEDRAGADVGAEGAVALDGGARRGVGGDGVGDVLRRAAGERAVGAAQGEVLAGDGRVEAVVVEQAGDVEGLAVEVDAVEGGEAAAEDPGPVRVAEQGGRLLAGGLLGGCGRGRCRAGAGRRRGRRPGRGPSPA